MKYFLIGGTFILFFLAMFFIVKLLNFRETPCPPEIALTPALPTPSEHLVDQQPQLFSLPEIEQHNIFDPLRGKAASEQVQATPNTVAPKFILIGICVLDDVQTAIIELGNNQKTAKRYFKVGDEVAEGYVLASVATNKAVLKKNNEVLNLSAGRERQSGTSGKLSISIEALTENK